MPTWIGTALSVVSSLLGLEKWLERLTDRAHDERSGATKQHDKDQAAIVDAARVRAQAEDDAASLGADERRRRLLDDSRPG